MTSQQNTTGPAKIGIFGGSFDPIHWGHLRPVRAAQRALGLDRIHYLPTAAPPHKVDRAMAPALARYCMVELALLADPTLVVDPHEFTPGRRAYTVETLEAFRERDAAAELFLLIGTDSFTELHLWHRWTELASLATIVVLARPGWHVDADLPALRGVPAERLVTLRHRLVDVSSTEVRRRLTAGDPTVAELVPRPVLDFLRKYALYT